MSHKIEFKKKTEWPKMTHTSIFTYYVIVAVTRPPLVTREVKSLKSIQKIAFEAKHSSLDLRRSFQLSFYVFILLRIFRVGFTDW